jgi:hypothetical protein
VAARRPRAHRGRLDFGAPAHERDYPAFFLEVVDSRQVPYIAVFDSLRGHVMGGQWARGDGLYPFPHG